MVDNIKIIIDPRSGYSYGSMYCYALSVLFGSQRVLYDLKPFIAMPACGNSMRFIVCREGLKPIKYFLHLNDSYILNEEEYAWCDVYGCVNTNRALYPQERFPKLITLAPSFGIRVEKNLISALYNTTRDLLSDWNSIWNSIEWDKKTQRDEIHHFANIKHYYTRRYKMWKWRLPLAAYNNCTPSADDYVFFMSTLWYNDELNKNDEGVNLRRARFIRACKSIENLQFEGGLLGDDSSSNDLFADVLTMKRIPFTEWIEKTKRSALVFNTPAFWNCHGWKLGEYLALGKCIISTKLSNDLPYPLEHGVNIHFVEETEEAMREAIEYILSHPEYRHKLEHGAKKYWEKYGSPEGSLRLLGIV